MLTFRPLVFEEEDLTQGDGLHSRVCPCTSDLPATCPQSPQRDASLPQLTFPIPVEGWPLQEGLVASSVPPQGEAVGWGQETLCFYGFSFKRDARAPAPAPHPQQPWSFMMRFYDITCSFIFPLK